MHSLLRTVGKLQPVAQVGQKVVGRRTAVSHVVSGPPQRKISKLERGVIGTLFLISGLAIPCWTLYHIPTYIKREE